MKKIVSVFSMSLLMFAYISTPLNVKAAIADRPTTVSTSHTADSLTANSLIARLQEIKAIDKSKLSSAEKKELRKETRNIKKHLRDISGGVYISAGALILIVLLIVLLL